jgi:FkbM family methyltransferase
MAIRGHLRKLKRMVIVTGRIAGETGGAAALKWLALSVARASRKMKIKVAGIPVVIRTGSTDGIVAITSIGGEFDKILELSPTLRHDFIVDAGGYIGTAAIVFARAYPDATVVTIEPSSENYAILVENVKAYPNIKPINAALSNESGTLQLHNRGTGNWGFTIVAAGEGHSGPVLHSVECVTVAQLLGQFGKVGIDIFKIDIEGGEYKLLSSATEWIGKTDTVCIELHDRIVDGCSAVYEKAMAGRRNSQLDGEKHLSLAA